MTGQYSSTVGGGWVNASTGVFSTIGGGEFNTNDADTGVIGGGVFNHANGTVSVIGGGSGNLTAGYGACVPGGRDNSELGSFSFAAGYRANANHSGAFVWADSTEEDFASTADRQFIIRAQGGVGIGKNNPQAQLDVEGNAVVSGDVGIGTTTPQAKLDVAGKVRCDLLELNSDRNVKSEFTNVDSREILSKLASLPIARWHYTNAPGIRHIGPMAQDFKAAFGVGEDDKHLSVVDGIGVALASIQGLQQELQYRDEQLQQKDARIAALELKLAELEQTNAARFAVLENLISHAGLRTEPKAQPTQASHHTRINY